MKVRYNIKSILAGSIMAVVLAYAGVVCAAEAYSPFAPAAKSSAKTLSKSKKAKPSRNKNIISLL